MARLGIRRFDDLIGRTELLEADEAIDHWKARGVDLSGLLAQARRRATARRCAACTRPTRRCPARSTGS